jgi:hypothetical protein
MSRPISVKPDATTLWDLAFLSHDDSHIAEIIGCHQSLISRRPDLRKVIAQARDEAADALVAAWRASSQGALRAPDRDRQLVALVRQARERKIRRVKPAV